MTRRQLPNDSVESFDSAIDQAQPSDSELKLYLAVRRGRDIVLGPIARGLAALRIAPAMVSGFGVVCAAGFAVFASDSIQLAQGSSTAVAVGSCFGLALASDALDGALARVRGKQGARGKLVDMTCDSATYLLILLGLVLGHRVSAAHAVVAAYLSTLLLFLGTLGQRSIHGDVAARLRGGAWAHLPKVWLYVGIAASLLGGPSRLDLNWWLVVANVFGAICLVLLFVRVWRGLGRTF